MRLGDARTRMQAETDDRNERARAAVKAFRSMQHGLTGYARAITGDPKVRVEVSAGPPHTDGKIIYYRPPIRLGDRTPHDAYRCDERDQQTGLQVCPACAIREEVLVNIYHEIAHIAFGTFAPTSAADLKDALSRGVKEWGSEYAEKMKQRIDAAPPQVKGTYLGLASLISPFLPSLLNSLEDARVDSAMFDARKGTRKMLMADTYSLFRDGIENAAGERVMWSENELNSQAAVACYLVASGYKDWQPYLHEKIGKDFSDPELVKLLGYITKGRSMSETYELSFPVLERLRELGYMRLPEEQDEQEEESGESGDDQSEDNNDSSEEESDDSGTTGGDSGDPEDSQGREGEGSSGSESSPEADRDSGDSGSSDKDNPKGAHDDASSSGDDEAGEASEGGESSDGGEASDKGDSIDSSEPGADPVSRESGDGHDQSDSDGGADGSLEEDGDASSRKDGHDPTRAGEAEDEAPESGGDGGSEGVSGEGGASSDDRGSDSQDQGEESDTGVSERDAGSQGASGDPEDDEQEHSGAEDPSGSDEVEPEGQGSSDREGEGEGSGDERPGAAEAGLPEGEADEVREDPFDGDQGEEGSDDGLSSVLDSGADDGEGGIPVPEWGLPEDVEKCVGKMHDEHADACEEHGNQPVSETATGDEKAIMVAVIQGQYFETPSANVSLVEEFRDGEGPAWELKDHLKLEERIFLGIECDVQVPESVLGPNLLKLRRVFDDNKIATHERHRRSGKVDAKVLGRRAWSGDDRLFSKKRIPGKKDYSVLIAIDISSSNFGTNLALVKRAAFAQADLMSRLGVEFAVIAHHCGAEGRLTERSYTMQVYHVKDWSQPWDDKAKGRLAGIGAAGGNLDGHALEFARKQLDKCDTTDRILLYYTDGKMPAANKEEELEILQREIKTCKRKGYTLLGVGIQTDSPTRHGLDTVQVDTDEDLKAVVEHLGRRLANPAR